MSTIKKTTTKATKSPAPATKAVTAKPTKKAPAAVPSAPARKVAPAAAAAPSPIAPAVPAGAPKPSALKPLATTISARVDVGFGNTLYLRGEGGSLSWNQGRQMDCVGADLWQIVLTDSARNYSFKFLLNDVTWSTGPDFSAAAGATAAFTPEF